LVDPSFSAARGKAPGWFVVLVAVRRRRRRRRRRSREELPRSPSAAIGEQDKEQIRSLQ
jgi:hypothetical protein